MLAPRTRVLLYTNERAGEDGIEPPCTGSKPAVLPLDDSPIKNKTESS